MSSTALVQPAAGHALARSRTDSPARQSPVTRSQSALKATTSTPQRVAVPASSPAAKLTPSQSTPGQWQHPRMDEVIRRQSANHFDSGNVTSIVISGIAIVLSMLVKPTLSYIRLSTLTNSQYTDYLLLALQLTLIANIVFATQPLWRTPDTCEDIPLDTKQRHALGLPPMSRPATPQEEAQYITPPRYSRSNTPNSSSSSLRVQATNSPLSGRGSPIDSHSPYGLMRQSSSGSPYSASPLTNALFKSDDARARRGSFGSPGAASRASPLGDSEFERIGSPSKTGRASVGLNSKWLYQKGRASPSALGSGWGTGSVFN